MKSLLNLVGIVLILTAVATVRSAPQGQYVWDLLPTPLNAEQVTALFAAAVPGETFPIYNDPPKTSFTCQGKLGYYADPQAGCQAFQRCTLGGDQISYLCPNGTLFNQLVLVCDWWFNVDCSKAESYYNFANPRIYDQKAKLHDTPPPSYIAPWQRAQLVEFQRQINAQIQLEQAATTQLQQTGAAQPANVYVQQQPQQQVFVPSSAVQLESPTPIALQGPSMFSVPQSASVQQDASSVNTQENAIDIALHALEQRLKAKNGAHPEEQKLDVTFVPEASQQQQRAISFLSPEGGVPHLSISPLALKPFSVRKAQ